MKKYVSFILAFIIFASFAGVSISAEETPLAEVHVRIVWDSEIVEYASVSASIIRFSDAQCTAFLEERSFNVTQANMWERVLRLEPGYYMINSIIPANEWRMVVEGQSELFEVKEGVMYVYAGIAPPSRSYTLPEETVVYGKDAPDFWIWSKDYLGLSESSQTTTSQSADESKESIDWDEYMREMFGEETSTSQRPREESEETSTVQERSVPDSSEVIKSKSKDPEEKKEGSSMLTSFIVFIGVMIVVFIVYFIYKRRQLR